MKKNMIFITNMGVRVLQISPRSHVSALRGTWSANSTCRMVVFQVALVSWTESVGLTLVNRDMNEITLQTPIGDKIKFKVLRVFPFTSETKRMGIIVKVRSYFPFLDPWRRNLNQKPSALPRTCIIFTRSFL